MWTVNFQMFKLVLEKAEESEIKLPTFAGEWKKQKSSKKTSISDLLTMLIESESEFAQSCPTLCDPMDCNPPVSSVRGIFQASVLEWVAISFSRGSFQPRERTWVSCTAGRRFTVWATREAQGSQFSHEKGVTKNEQEKSRMIRGGRSELEILV